MDGISLSLATLLALAVESILFGMHFQLTLWTELTTIEGLFFALVLVTLYILVDKGEWRVSKHRMAMTFIMLTMAGLGGAVSHYYLYRYALSYSQGYGM